MHKPIIASALAFPLAMLLAGCPLDDVLPDPAPLPTSQPRTFATPAPDPKAPGPAQDKPRADIFPVPFPSPQVGQPPIQANVLVPSPVPAPVQSVLPVPTPAVDTEPTPTPAPVATQQPIDTPVLQPTPTPAQPVAHLWTREEMLAVFQEGVTRDLAGRNQYTQLTGYLNGYTDGQLLSISNLLDQCQSDTEDLFVLKALCAGESWQNLVAYADDIRGVDTDTLIRKSTMRDTQDLIQQWQDACGPGVAETVAGELDPRYAWELNKQFDVTQVDPYGANKDLADQQKQWLEQYGGVAVPRGDTGGQGISITQMLNDKLTPLVHASYDFQAIATVADALDQIGDILASGFDVPIRVTWTPPGEPEYGHFMTALNIRGVRGSRELEIHDTYTGTTAWVSEQNMANNNFSPIFDRYVRLTHFYIAHPQ